MRWLLLVFWLGTLLGCSHLEEKAALSRLQTAALGEMDKQAAFSRFGSADHVNSTPEGQERWVYTNNRALWEGTYTLVFSEDGLLYDMIYVNYSRTTRMNARKIQNLK